MAAYNPRRGFLNKEGICTSINLPHALDNGRLGIIKNPVNCHVIGWGEAGLDFSLFNKRLNCINPTTISPREAGMPSHFKPRDPLPALVL
jgi:hypothetical protein